MKRIFKPTTILAAAAVLLCLNSHEAKDLALTEENEAAQRLWEQAIAAKGGREKLHSVRTMAVSLRAAYDLGRLGKTNSHYVWVYAFPDKLWSWLDDRPSDFGLNVTLYNGERQEVQTLMSGMTSPKLAQGPGVGQGDRYFLLRDQLAFLMETQWVRPVPMQTWKSSVERRRVDVVRATIPGRVVDFYLDEVSHLPLMVAVCKPGEPPQECLETDPVVLGDYAAFSEIQLPRRVGQKTASYEVNPELAPDIFERPPSIEAGPYAWRPKSQQSNK